MAVLTQQELAKLRREIADKLSVKRTTVDFVKSDLNSVLQALEDWFETNPTGVVGAGKIQMNLAINAASLFSFSIRQKAVIVSVYLDFKLRKVFDAA